MTEILIRGTELPKNKDEQLVIGYDRFGKLKWAKSVWNGMDWTIPEEGDDIKVLTTHGDLVELQEVKDMICEESSSSDTDVRPEQLLGLLKGIPIILEASK